MKQGIQYRFNWRYFYANLLLLSLSAFGWNSKDKQFIYQNDKDVCGVYCEMAANYWDKVMSQDFDVYYFQKSLSSLFTHFILKGFNVELTAININRGLEVLSYIYLFVALYFWWRVSIIGKLSDSGYFIGFTGIFMNQLFIKISPYSQDGSDNLGLLLGLGALYYLVSKSLIGLWVVFFLAHLVQPQLKILIIPLIIFYGARNFYEHQRVKPRRRNRKLFFSLYVLIFSASFLIFENILPISHGWEYSIPWLFYPISTLLSSLILSSLLSRMLEGLRIRQILIYLYSIKKRLLSLVSLEVIFNGFVSYIGRGEILSINSKVEGQVYFLLGNYYHSVAKPLLWIIAPIIFFGPIILLILMRHKIIFGDYVKSLDFGLATSLILIIFLLPNSESRHHISYLPWLVFLLVKTTKLNTVYLCLFYVPLVFLSSRWYANYSQVNLPNDPYLMSWGPWYSLEVYVKATIVALVLFGTHFVFRRRIFTDSTSRDF